MKIIFLASAVVVIILNSYVTLRVWRKSDFEIFQKIAQSFIIWLIPIIGALFILTFMKSDEIRKGPDNPNDGQGNDSMPGGVQ